MPLSEAQQSIADCESRFRVACCGRRFGKTFLAIREIAKNARYPDRKILYLAPTYRQAKQIVWEDLKNKLNDLNWIQSINESELTIKLINGSMILLRSADAGDSIRGLGFDMAVVDEAQDINPDIFYSVVRPALADREGSGMIVGTPKGRGNWFYDVYTQANDQEDWSSFSYTTLDGGRVSPDEIESARRHLDDRTFRQEFLATFETYAGVIYYAFGEHNVSDKLLDNHRLLWVGMDFNVDPMSAVVGVPTGEGLHIIDEITIYGSNTEEMAQEIKNRYPQSRIWAFPDPAGAARKTSSNTTDHNILRNAGFTVKTHRVHPPIKDRVNSVNSMLKKLNDGSRLLIHPKCKKLIETLTKHTYKEGTQIPDKTQGLDHMADCFGYLVEFNFPVRVENIPVEQPSRWGVNTVA